MARLCGRCLTPSVPQRADPLVEGTPYPGRDPYDSNQAIPTLIATKDRTRFLDLFPNLRIGCVEWSFHSSLTLSGGFKSWTLIPEGLVRHLLSIDHRVGGWASE